MKNNPFFDKVEDDVYRLMNLEEDIKEKQRPAFFNQHELEYFKEKFVLKLEEELIEAKDKINSEEDVYESYHNLVDFLEKLLDEFYILDKTRH